MQDGAKDCGICSLLIIIRQYGGDIPKEYLRMITNTTLDGVNAFSLLEAGRKVGFDATGVNGDVFDIDDKYLPCIAHVIIDDKYKHFIVIHKIDKKNNTIIIADPSKGIIKMTKNQFLEISTNNFLFFTPNKKIPIIKTDNKIKNIILDFLYQNKKIIVFITILSLLFTFLNILTSFNFQFVLEKALAYNSKHNLCFIFIIMIILSLFKAFVEYFRSNCINFLSNKLDYKLIVDSFSHILSLPYLYYKNRTTGEILSRINDLKELKEYISHIIITVLVDFILVFFVFIFLFSINKILSLIIIIFTILYFLILFIFNKILDYKIKILKEEDTKSNSYMVELINGNDSIKSMNNLNRVINKFSYKYDMFIKENYSLINVINLKKLLCDILGYMLSLLIIFIGGYLVINEELTLGNLITFNGLIYYFWEPIKNILNFDLLFKNIKIIIERINELLAYKEETLYDEKSIYNIKGDIYFKNLVYSYGNKKELFALLNKKIIKGTKIVICGNSGCGKSTLARIISGFIPIERGMVFVDNRDINEYNLWSLRENITYVSQNEFLFTDTIYNNIDIINARDYDKVSEIGKIMLVDEFVDNYNTLLEENGCNLSGGERQRIILARTFYKESNVYILDESFSQIDSKKERIILTNIFEKYKDKTIIVISHRFDNNDLYDEVINLENLNGNNILSK